MSTQEQIETLTAEAKRANEEAKAAYARHYAALAAVSRLRGDTLDAEFHEALSRSWREQTDEASAAVHRTYVRLTASRCLNGSFDGVPDEHLVEVRAEMERLRAESQGGERATQG